MTNVNVLLKLFIEYLQIERNYSKYTIEHYQHDIHEFYMFMSEQRISGFEQVIYADIRIFLTVLYRKKLSQKNCIQKTIQFTQFL